MEPGQIVLIVIVNSIAGLGFTFFGIKQQMAKAKQKHEAELEKQRIAANLELEKEKLKKEAEQARLAREAAKPKLCAYCHSENPATANYCDGCGSKLSSS